MKRINFDKDWFFFVGKVDFFTLLQGKGTPVNLPHDYEITTNPDKDTPEGKLTGFFKGNVVSYVKNLFVPLEWKEHSIILEFDGSYMNTEIFINGMFVDNYHHGYSPFHIDLTDRVNYGEENRLIVIVNNSAPNNARWYSGTGIYRHVDLLVGPKLHLEPWSIYGYTTDVNKTTAFITVEVSITNDSDQQQSETLKVIFEEDRSAQVVSTSTIDVEVPAHSSIITRCDAIIDQPKIWDIDHPNLYRIKAILGSEIDNDSTLFGIRTLSLDTKNGFQLNGRTIKLKGGCVHHDNGILGAASFYDSEYRKMKLHKDNGFNAIRTAHNPPSSDMLEACDRLGLLVIDEAFDGWRNIHAGVNDFHLYFDEDWRKVMSNFIKRDRNHPSIIMWSTGNEVVERNDKSKGYLIGKQLADFVLSLDNTRYITNALCVFFNGLDDKEMMMSAQSWMKMMTKTEVLTNLANDYIESIFAERTKQFANVLDVVGYNYMFNRYEKDHELFPERIFCGTESYPKFIDWIWDEVERLPYVIGDFTWTSHDYIGEAGLGIVLYADSEDEIESNPLAGPTVPYPWRTAFSGDFDLVGNDRPQLHLRKIVWGNPETYISVHHPKNHDKKAFVGRWGWHETYNCWAFPGYEKKTTTVEVFSGADTVELYLDENLIGVESAGKASRYKATFTLEYEPGTLTAISKTKGKEVSRQTLTTNGPAHHLRCTSDKTELRSNGHDLAFINIEIVDEKDNHVYWADRTFTTKVTGAGSLQALGTGIPATEENYTTGIFTSYQGHLLAVVRSGYEPGPITFSLEAKGLPSIELNLTVK